jgi:hypothetical protein
MFSMRSTLLLVLVLAALVPAAHAQTLTGRVTDSGGAPLPGVNVVVSDFDRGTVTEPDGRYMLRNLPADSLTVAFSFVGYERAERAADLTAGDATLDVVLRETVEALEAVTVREEGTRTALTRAPQSISVLDAEDLATLRGQTLGQTLNRLPGVTTLSTGPSIQKPVIRGLHSDRVIVINGHPRPPLRPRDRHQRRGAAGGAAVGCRARAGD